MRFDLLRWLLVVAIALHNFEEWLTVRRHGALDAGLFDGLGPVSDPPAWPELEVALLIATLVPAMVVAACAIGKPSARKDWAVCFIAGVFLANVFLPHIPAGIAAGGYAPGLASAVLITLPLAFMLLRRARAENRISGIQLWGALVGGIVALPLSLAALWTVARTVA